MVHQYKVGDKVRIKEKEGYGDSYPFNYTSEMYKKYGGRIVTISHIIPLEAEYCRDCLKYNGDKDGYRIKEDDRKFSWHSSMFEPVLEDSEQKIQTLISLKEGDLIPICDMIGRIQSDEDFSEYYLDFDDITVGQEHFTCCKKLRELVPDFEKIANEYDATRQDEGCFPEFSTINDLVKFVQAVNNAYNSKKSITTPKTLNENEIKFQKPKAAFSRGSVPKGNPICGRKHKTAIVVGRLSNQEISC